MLLKDFAGQKIRLSPLKNSGLTFAVQFMEQKIHSILSVNAPKSSAVEKNGLDLSEFWQQSPHCIKIILNNKKIHWYRKKSDQQLIMEFLFMPGDI